MAKSVDFSLGTWGNHGKTWENMEKHGKTMEKHGNWKSIGYPLVHIQTANWKMAIKRVDLAMRNGDVPSFFVCLPEGMVDFMENPFING